MTPLVVAGVIGVVLFFVATLLAVTYYTENQPGVKKTALRGSRLTVLVDARGEETCIEDWLMAIKKWRLSHVDIVFVVRQNRGLRRLAKKGEVAFYHPQKTTDTKVLRDAYAKSQHGAIVVTMPLRVSPDRQFLARLVQTVKQQKERAVYYDISPTFNEMTLVGFTEQLSESITAQLKSIASMFKSPVIMRRSWQAAYHADDFLREYPLAYYYDARVDAPCSDSVRKAHIAGLIIATLIVVATLLLAARGVSLPLIVAWTVCTIAALLAFLLSLRGRRWWLLVAMPAFYFLLVPVHIIKELHPNH